MGNSVESVQVWFTDGSTETFDVYPLAPEMKEKTIKLHVGEEEKVEIPYRQIKYYRLYYGDGS